MKTIYLERLLAISIFIFLWVHLADAYDYSAKSLNNTPGWYRVDAHVHTKYSDGSNTPSEVLAMAEEAALDVIISTDHNRTSSYEEWARVQKDSILVINGMEATNIDGHWNIYGPDPAKMIGFRENYTDSSRYEKAIAFAKDAGLFTVVNHPYLGGLEFWYDKSRLDGIEVWNNYWDPTDDRAVEMWNDLLVAGIYRVIVGGSDFHNSGDQQLGTPNTVVRSASLSDEDIIAGIAGGHSYIAQNSSVSLDMNAYSQANPEKKAGLGDYLVCEEDIAVVRFKASVDGVLTMIDQDGVCFRSNISAGEENMIRLEKGCRWVRAELRDGKGNMLALTNPIFMGAEGKDYRHIQ